MNEESDSDLLARFVREGAQAAFAELVQRKVNLVYAAACRQTGGDAHLAHDVTQAVFLALAMRAKSLQRHRALTGWLYTTTRFLARNAARAQRRWQHREKEATAMNLLSREPEPAWENLRPVIDEALYELGERDREALLLRFFEGRSHAEVGVAIGLAENAARMRVDRALEKLRERLARRGITSTAAALGGTLAAQPAVAAPAGLAASAAAAGLAGATVASASGIAAAFSVLTFMSSTKIAVGALGAVAMVGLGAWLALPDQSRSPATTPPDAVASQSRTEITALQIENARLQAELARGRATTLETIAATPAGTPASAAGYPELQVLLDLRRRNLAKLEFEFFEDARVQSSFADLFALSPPEVAILQRALDAAQQRLNALTEQNSTVGRAPNGEVSIGIKPFPEAGGAIYDEVLKTFADTLGLERYHAFLTLGAEQVEKTLGGFGTAERRVTLSRETIDGEVHYRIVDVRQASPKDHSNYVSDRLTADRFVREIGPLIHMLPPDFAPPR